MIFVFFAFECSDLLPIVVNHFSRVFYLFYYIFLFIKGYVPFGTPIVVGLLLPNPTLKQIIFWQWLNQRYINNFISENIKTWQYHDLVIMPVLIMQIEMQHNIHLHQNLLLVI
jgi:hypothetical protein